MLKLNLDPSFTADVQVTVPGQTEPGTVKLTLKYMNRSNYLLFLDSLKEKKGKTVPQDQALLDFVLGWDLAEEFNLENVKIFLDNYPCAFHDIFQQYSQLLMNSRIKN